MRGWSDKSYDSDCINAYHLDTCFENLFNVNLVHSQIVTGLVEASTVVNVFVHLVA